ncbi:MAG: outer membrane beta-barrel protein [Opitutae bacterium]|nr:outer membrane beta-barrel protein [Opitutae bacterium]
MLIRKLLNKIALASLVAGVSVPAFADGPLDGALYNFGDVGALSLLCSVEARYNDNIYLESSSKNGDVIWTFSPGLELELGGSESESKFRISYIEDLILYTSNSKNNSQDSHLAISYNYTGSKFKATVAAGYDQQVNTSNRDRSTRGHLIRYQTYYARALGTYDITEKVSIMSGFKWDGRRYDSQRYYYNDRETYAIPVNLYHSILTEKIKAGISYEYRYTDLAGAGKDNGKNPGYEQVHFIGLTATGDFTDALTLDGRIGCSTRDYNRRTTGSGNTSHSTLSLMLNANYKVTEKTTADLRVSRDFEIAGDASSITSTGIQLGVAHVFSSKWMGNVSIAYRQDDYDYSNRCDDVYTLSVGAHYNINDYLSASASYSFQWNDSNGSYWDYTDNIISLAISFRY